MANPNTLTGLIPVIYEALDVVAQEKVGFINGATTVPSAEQAAKDQDITIFQTPATAAVDITPGSYAPDTGGQTITPVTMKITKSKAVPIQWTGDEQLAVRGQINNILRDQFAQGIRALRNEQESDLALAAISNAGTVSGAAGTTPFNTANDTSDFAAVTRALDDLGTPDLDRYLTLGSAAVENLRGKQGLLNKVNEAGSEEFVRKGALLEMYGLNINQSRQVKTHTKGTGASYVLNGAHAEGTKTITVKTGTGTITVGDVVTINGVAYVATSAISAPGSFTIGRGLVAAGVDGDTVTVGNTYVGNVAYHKSALMLATRVPVMPQGGDGAVDVMDITDPATGLTYQVAMYRVYRQIHIEIGQAWGVKAVKPEYINILRG